MRLEIRTYPVRAVVLGDRTAYADGVLTVDAAAAREVVLAEGGFADAAVHLARPGDSTRIVHVLDVAEPRVKLAGTSADYPGFLGPQATAGDGIVHRLGGVAIVETGPAVGDEPTWWREALIDMSGPGADLTAFGQTHNLVLTVEPGPEQTWQQFNVAVRRAGLRLGAWLAETTRDVAPPETRVYELGAPDPVLPRVVYVYVMYSPYLYGEIEEHLVPTLAHPNELLDGALVNSRNGPASARPATWLELNNPVVRALYDRHGRDLNFVGVILTSGHDTKLASKQRIAAWTAKLARLAGASGAVLMYPSSGHSYVTLMLCCQALEQAGVKTVLLHMEMASTPEDSGFVHAVPEAVAVVSTGNMEEVVQLPAVERVLGGDTLFESGAPAAGPLAVTLRHLIGATNQLGGGRVAGREF